MIAYTSEWYGEPKYLLLVVRNRSDGADPVSADRF
jgi:hypothetical protein